MVPMKIMRDISGLPPNMQSLAAGLLDRAKAMKREAPVRKAGAVDIPEIPFVPEVRVFDVGGVKYEVREPVLEQERQIITLLRDTRMMALIAPLLSGHDLEFSGEGLEKLLNLIANNIDPFDFLEALCDSLARFYAIIMTPAGQSVQDKDLDEIEAQLNGNLTFTMQAEALQSFFVLGKALIKNIFRRAKRDKAKT